MLTDKTIRIRHEGAFPQSADVATAPTGLGEIILSAATHHSGRTHTCRNIPVTAQEEPG